MKRPRGGATCHLHPFLTFRARLRSRRTPERTPKAPVATAHPTPKGSARTAVGSECADFDLQRDPALVDVTVTSIPRKVGSNRSFHILKSAVRPHFYSNP